MKLDKFDCYFDPTVFANASCNVKFVDRYTQLVSGTTYVAVPQYIGRVHVTLFYKFRVYRKFLVEYDADMCDLAAQHPLLALALPIIRKYSNQDLKCPYQGNFTLNRLTVDSRFLPNTIVPSGGYRLDMRVYHPKTNNTLFESKLYATIPESRDAHVDRAMG